MTTKYKIGDIVTCDGEGYCTIKALSWFDDDEKDEPPHFQLAREMDSSDMFPAYRKMQDELNTDNRRNQQTFIHKSEVTGHYRKVENE